MALAQNAEQTDAWYRLDGPEAQPDACFEVGSFRVATHQSKQGSVVLKTGSEVRVRRLERSFEQHERAPIERFSFHVTPLRPTKHGDVVERRCELRVVEAE
jgi:hypothetical protein